jgi:U1 small nuclear ribonucleoprotein
VAYKLEQEIALWDPNSRETSTQDPFKTLFVARINYYTSESKLRREFETFGSIKSINLVQDANSGKPKGYAFIEYEHERDMHCKSGKKRIQKIYLGTRETEPILTLSVVATG